MRSVLVTIAALLALCTPMGVAAQGYLTPEQMLQQNNGAFLVPSHQRGAAWAANLEAQQRADRHPTIIHEPWDPVQDNGLPPPVAVDELPTDNGPIQPTSTLDPLTARLLERIENENDFLHAQIANTGRPLAQTGPAAILSVIAMLAATGFTVYRARSLRKFVREL